MFLAVVSLSYHIIYIVLLSSMTFFNMNIDDFCDTYCWPYIDNEDAFSTPLHHYMIQSDHEHGHLILTGSHMRTCPITRTRTFVFHLNWVGNNGFDLLGWKLAVCVEEDPHID